jgi:hypothetical protein
LRDNCAVTVALSNITAINEADKIAKYLVDVFGRKSRTFSLLKQLILKDIEEASRCKIKFENSQKFSSKFDIIQRKFYGK